jgi:uncharacterized hydrophobic protein (TIGR00271 family)
MTSEPESLTSSESLISSESLTSSHVDEVELRDSDERVDLELARGVDWNLLTSPVVIRALVGIVVASLILAWPERSNTVLARLIGLGILAVSATTIWGELQTRPRRWLNLLVGLAGVALGVGLNLVPDQPVAVLSRLVGAALIASTLRDLWQHRRRAAGEHRLWVLSRSLAVLAFGLLLVAFPDQVFSMATTLLALGWIALSLLVIVATIDPSTDGAADYAGATRLLGDWLESRPKSADDRQALYDKILYEGAVAPRRIVRFFSLMGFASAIASMGVVTDSTAVVIGAMLIAPLMTPLMGMAISLVMGWPNRLGRSTLIAVGGICFAIGVGVVIGLLAPVVIDTSTNGQIVARTSPTTLDLITALAAGAAGAYGLSRPDVSDSLPGVAIAISLVPPLTVVGISYSQGDFMSGNGALLLFLTNAFAILVMGGLTFIITGVTPLQQLAEGQHRVRSAIAAVAAFGAVILGALLLNGAQVAANVFEQATVEDTIDSWLAEHPEHAVVRIDLEGETVGITIVGPSDNAPTAQSAASALSEALDRRVTADLRLIVEERSVATAD